MTKPSRSRRLSTAAIVRSIRGSETGKKSDAGQQQQVGVELFRSVGLHEGAKLLVVAVLADLVADLLAQRPPFIERPVEAERLRALDRAIVGDPGHDFRVGEMLRRPAHFPDALIGLAARLFQMVGERE